MSLFLPYGFLFKVQLFSPSLFTLQIDFQSLPIVHRVPMSLESPAAYLSSVPGEVSVLFHHAPLLICGLGPATSALLWDRLVGLTLDISFVNIYNFLCNFPRDDQLKQNLNDNSAMAMSILMMYSTLSFCVRDVGMCSVLSSSLRLHELQPTSLLCPSKNTEMDFHFQLQGIFQTQGLKPCLLPSSALAGGSSTTVPLGSHSSFQVDTKEENDTFKFIVFHISIAYSTHSQSLLQLAIIYFTLTHSRTSLQQFQEI